MSGEGPSFNPEFAASIFGQSGEIMATVPPTFKDPGDFHTIINEYVTQLEIQLQQALTNYANSHGKLYKWAQALQQQDQSSGNNLGDQMNNIMSAASSAGGAASGAAGALGSAGGGGSNPLSQLMQSASQATQAAQAGQSGSSDGGSAHDQNVDKYDGMHVSGASHSDGSYGGGGGGMSGSSGGGGSGATAVTSSAVGGTGGTTGSSTGSGSGASGGGMGGGMMGGRGGGEKKGSPYHQNQYTVEQKLQYYDDDEQMYFEPADDLMDPTETVKTNSSSSVDNNGIE